MMDINTTENNLWMLLYISIPMFFFYLLEDIILKSRKLQIAFESKVLTFLGKKKEDNPKKRMDWSIEIRGRFIAITNAFIIVPSSLYLLFTKKEFYQDKDLFSHDNRGDVILSLGFGFWIYHTLFIVIPELKKHKLHLPHHLLVLICIYLIIRDKVYQNGMLLAFATELPNPCAQFIFIFRFFEMKETTSNWINAVLLWFFWSIGRMYATGYLLYCYYLNWDGILTKLSPTLKIMNFVGTSFAVLANSWWYFRLNRLLLKKLIFKQKKKKEEEEKTE